MKKFSEALKELRVNAGYSQKDVYTSLGINQSTFSAWETGRAEPSADMLLKLCKLYKVKDIFSAFGYDGYNEDGSLSLNINEIELVEKYRALDKHGKEVIDFLLCKEHERSESMAEEKNTNIIPTRLISYYQRLASAGNGQIVFEDMPVGRISIPDIPKYKRVAYAIGVNGHSMEPLYEDGDILLVEPTCEISVGEIGIFIVGNESFVKKLGERELISLNKGYGNIPLTEDSKCMGRVVDNIKA